MGYRSRWKVLVAGGLAGLVAVSIAFAPATAAALPATLHSANTATITADGTAQPAGDLLIYVPPPANPSYDTPWLPTGTTLVLALAGTAAMNCSTPGDSIGFSGAPTVTETTPRSDQITLRATPGSSAECSSIAADQMSFTLAQPTKTIRITGISYVAGTNTPVESVAVSLRGSCPGCDPAIWYGGCDTDRSCANANIVAAPPPTNAETTTAPTTPATTTTVAPVPPSSTTTTTTSNPPTTVVPTTARGRRRVSFIHGTGGGVTMGAVVLLLIAALVLALARSNGISLPFVTRRRRPASVWERRTNTFITNHPLLLSIGLDPTRRAIEWRKGRPE